MPIKRRPRPHETDPGFNRFLVWVAAIEGVLLLVLIAWWGYLHLVLARLVESNLAWAAWLAVIIVLSAGAWSCYQFARRRRFRFSLGALLVATCVVGVLSALVGNHLQRLQRQQAANRAVSHIRSRDGVVTIGVPTDASAVALTDYTDLRNATSVSFTGITLEELDFAQLAKVPSLVAITIKDAPIHEDRFALVRRLPNLHFLVLENTGASDDALRRIASMSASWRVFPSEEELKQWSLARVRAEKEGSAGESPQFPSR